MSRYYDDELYHYGVKGMTWKNKKYLTKDANGNYVYSNTRTSGYGGKIDVTDFGGGKPRIGGKYGDAKYLRTSGTHHDERRRGVNKVERAFGKLVGDEEGKIDTPRTPGYSTKNTGSNRAAELRKTKKAVRSKIKASEDKYHDSRAKNRNAESKSDLRNESKAASKSRVQKSNSKSKKSKVSEQTAKKRSEFRQSRAEKQDQHTVGKMSKEYLQERRANTGERPLAETTYGDTRKRMVVTGLTEDRRRREEATAKKIADWKRYWHAYEMEVRGRANELTQRHKMAVKAQKRQKRQKRKDAINRGRR